MKTFLQFLEQVEEAQEKQKRDKSQNKAYIGAQIRAGIRQRSHVNRELEKRQESERDAMK
jgi:hypothetical protein